MEWRSCERLGLLPQGVKAEWDECSVWAHAQLIAYEQIREHEEFEELKLCQGRLPV